MNNTTNDTIYVVYSQSESSIIDCWSEDAYHLEEHWFTNEEQAELCAEYLNMSDNRTGYFLVDEVANGDNIDYKSLIEKEERKQKEMQALRAKESRYNNVDNYALYKSRIEGCNYYDTLKEFKEKYAYYIDGKEQV